MCRDTAWTLMANGSASSLTVASPLVRRATIDRRVGSASAANMASRSGSGNSSDRVAVAMPIFNQYIDQLSS